jgi:hypothetical protein
MKNKFTPLHIELILHYHCCCNLWPQHDAPAVIEFTDDLLGMGLIVGDRESGSGYRTTERGGKFVEKLCNTEIPVQVWQ